MLKYFVNIAAVTVFMLGLTFVIIMEIIIVNYFL